MSNDCKIPRAPRNVVFFGETGVGKSSTINLLLEAGTVASVSNDSQPCTRSSDHYETKLCGTPFTLWDTRGLGEGSSFFRNLFGGPRSEKELKKFLEQRHRNNELDLLVYYVRGSRATKASLKYYNTFCAVTRRLAAPVVIVVTHLEKEVDLEDWWKRNSSSFKGLEMEFDGYACISSLPGHARSAESRERLVELLCRKYRWEAKGPGSYFGSPVQRAVTAGKGPNLLRSVLRPWATGSGTEVPFPGRNVVDGAVPSSPASSTRYSGYYTPAESPQKSRPSTPVVQPPTPTTEEQTAVIQSSMQVVRPHSQNSLAAVSPVATFLRVNRSRSPRGEDTDSMESDSNSMFHESFRSSDTSEAHLPCNGENDISCANDGPRPSVLERLSDMPYKHLTATVRRKKGYATRSGSFGDIWECELIEGEHSRMVAVKAVKVQPSTSYGFEESQAHHKRHEKKLRRELKVWERLQHKNVVPLIGLVAGFGDLPSMVSPWYANESLTRYLALHREMELPAKYALLRDIAAGLCYLHSEDVVHGDLHSENVLIDENGAACLADFGLSFVNDFVGTSYLKSSVCGAIQFADPDLVKQAHETQDKVVHPTKPCDIYSFGGLMLHVLSGIKPYDSLKQPAIAIYTKVLRGERPHIPKHNEPWHESESLIRACWDPEERKRPSADEIPRRFPTHQTPTIQ